MVAFNGFVRHQVRLLCCVIVSLCRLVVLCKGMFGVIRSLDQLQVDGAIYKGKASQVFSAREKESGAVLALKSYRKKKLSTLERCENFCRKALARAKDDKDSLCTLAHAHQSSWGQDTDTLHACVCAA